LLENGEADALVWVQAFNVNAVPPETNLPTIVVGRSGMTFTKEPDVFIPVGTPGIDHAGHAYRMDNVVAIRLKNSESLDYPVRQKFLMPLNKLCRKDNVDKINGWNCL